MKQNRECEAVRKQLVESGGRTAHDLGLGRIVGQILVYLYLQPDACSLDKIEEELGLSKAAVSVGARQLEQLGLIKRVWVKGQRKKFYKSADNLAQALQQGFLSIVRQRVKDFGEQLESADGVLKEAEESDASAEVEFLKRRIARAGKLQKGLSFALGNPFVRILTKATEDRNN